MIDEKKIQSAIEILKGYQENDALFTDFEKKELPILIDLAEQVLEVKMPKKKPCGKSYAKDDCINCPYLYDCETIEFNKAIDLCTLAIAKEYTHNETVKLLEEKIEILEEEREKWWSKAETPDDIYLTPDILNDYVKKEDVEYLVEALKDIVNLWEGPNYKYYMKNEIYKAKSALNKFKGV